MSDLAEFLSVVLNGTCSHLIVFVCVFQALREDVERQMERERELQQRYGELLMEREALINSAQKY